MVVGLNKRDNRRRRAGAVLQVDANKGREPRRLSEWRIRAAEVRWRGPGHSPRCGPCGGELRSAGIEHVTPHLSNRPRSDSFKLLIFWQQKLLKLVSPNRNGLIWNFRTGKSFVLVPSTDQVLLANSQCNTWSQKYQRTFYKNLLILSFLPKKRFLLTSLWVWNVMKTTQTFRAIDSSLEPQNLFPPRQ